jgi:hypothetical protein
MQIARTEPAYRFDVVQCQNDPIVLLNRRSIATEGPDCVLNGGITVIWGPPMPQYWWLRTLLVVQHMDSREA